MILESAEDIKKYKNINKSQNIQQSTSKETNSNFESASRSKDVIKRFIPYFIYKPFFGYPRRDIDLLGVRKLARTPFVFSIIKTISDEIAAIDWDIVPVNDDDADDPVLQAKAKKIKEFFYNPNSNNESFRGLNRAVIKDILELDAGVIEKVYNRKGELSQLYSVDGATILANPDLHGSYENRADYIPPIIGDYTNQQMEYYYNNTLKAQAAYFQYNWTGGIWPVPFGRKEIIYIKSNDRSDSVYGESPVQVLYNIILILIYGSQVNLDMYVGNNLPTGMLSIINANKDTMKKTREYFNSLVLQNDEFNNNRKKFFNIPISNTDVKYTPFSLNAKEMQMLEQQKWYQQLTYQVFGVTPSEMGVTENVGRSESNEQSRIFKRKSLNPLLKLLEYNYTTNIVWELDPEHRLKFKFNDYDVEAEYRKAELNDKLKSTWTINEIRKKDNMPELDDDKFNTISNEGSSINTDMGNNFSDMNKNNTQSNKQDMQNEERSTEKQEVNNPETKAMKDIPKKTDYEQAITQYYKDLEKDIIGLL